MSVSVLILTLNEEVNLPGCLESVAWSDDVVVFDSFSSDRTVEIAGAAGARVVQRRFDNYAAHRNASLGEVPFRHPWVLVLDADERVTPALHAELVEAAAGAPAGTTLFRMRRRDFFLGRWLRRSSGYPTWFPRLVRPERVRVEREINEEFHTDGNEASLREDLVHYPFNKGIGYWFERHNRYSTMEAAALLREREEPLRIAGLFSREPVERRRSLKRLGYRLPGRPLLVFFYLYVFRLGILDGLPGLLFVALRATYETMIDLKVLELRRRARGLAV